MQKIRMIACLLGATVSQQALAQSAAQAPLPPDHYTTDEWGVDVASGQARVSTEPLTIGDPANGGLSFNWTLNGDFADVDWVHNHVGFANLVSRNGTMTVTVSFAGASRQYTGPIGSTSLTRERDGSWIEISGQNVTHYSANGSVRYFDIADNNSVYGNQSLISKFVAADGFEINYYYQDFSHPQLNSGSTTSKYVQSIETNTGYQIHLTFGTYTESGATYANPIPTKIVALNTAVERCPRTSNVCNPTNDWPTETIQNDRPYYDDNGSLTFTDKLGRTASYKIEEVSTDEGNDYYVSEVRPYGHTATGSDSKLFAEYDYQPVDGEGFGDYTIFTGYRKNGVLRTYDYTNISGGVRFIAKQGDRTVQSYDFVDDQITSAFHPETGKIDYTYDSSDRVETAKRTDGSGVEYQYSARGNVTQTTRIATPSSGAAPLITTSTYASTCDLSNYRTCNKPLTVTGPDQQTTEFEYSSAHGNLVRRKHLSSGQETRYNYQPVSSRHLAASGSMANASQPVHKLHSTSQCSAGSAPGCIGTANEVVSQYVYETATGANGTNGELISTTVKSGDNSLSATTTLEYDDVGNLISVNGPLPGDADTQTTFYDELRRPTAQIGADPDGNGSRKSVAQRITYAANGGVDTVDVGAVSSRTASAVTIMTAENRTKYHYDAKARPIGVSQIDPTSNVTLAQSAQVYISNRIRCTIQIMTPVTGASLPTNCTPNTGTGGTDRVTQFIYSFPSSGQYNHGLLHTAVKYAAGSPAERIERRTFDTVGRINSVTDGNGNTTTYQFDGHGRLYRTRYPSTSVGTRASSTSDYLQHSYNSHGRLSQIRLRDGKVHNFTYDSLGRLTNIDLPSGEADLTYAFDLFGRPTSVTGSLGGSVAFGYDGLSRRITETGRHGTFTSGYDIAGRRTSLAHPDGFTVNYVYDNAGALMSVAEASGMTLATFNRDQLGRTTGVTRGNGTSASFAFDAASRLTTFSENLGGSSGDFTKTFAYNAASQISQRTTNNGSYEFPDSFAVNRAYSVNGLNQYTQAGGTSFGYDGRGNLTQSGSTSFSYDSQNRMLAGDGSGTFKYDPIGRLLSVGGSGLSGFGYDGLDITGEYAANGAVLKRYVHAPGIDQPLVWYEGSGTNDRRWLHRDERGSIMAVTNGSGGVIDINSYDEFGIPASGNTGRFGYTGQIWLPEVGMWYYKARMYSPTLGRFMQTDPIGYADGLNWYAYVGNDPVNAVDPLGLTCVERPNVTTCQDWIGDPPDNITVNGYRGRNLRSWAFGRDNWANVGGPDVGPPNPPKPVRPAGAPQSDEGEEEGGLLRCLADAGSGAADGLLDPEGQAISIAGGLIDSAGGTAVDARNSARGRPSATFGRNATIVPGSNVKLTGRQLLVRGAKRFIPGYAAASAGVALVTGGIAAYNSEACQGLFD